MADIGTQLRTARQAQGQTQQEIADQLHVTRQTISNWETGRSLPDIDSLIALSDGYHLSLDQLLRSEDVLADLREKQAGFDRAQQRYRVNLVAQVGLLVVYVTLVLRHLRQGGEDSTMILLLVLATWSLQVTRRHYWQLGGRRVSLKRRTAAVVTALVGVLMAAVVVAVIGQLSFYNAGYGIGIALVTMLGVYGLLPVRE